MLIQSIGHFSGDFGRKKEKNASESINQLSHVSLTSLLSSKMLRSNLGRDRSGQTNRDSSKTRLMNIALGARFGQMNKRTSRYAMRTIISTACHRAAEAGTKKPDRLCFRLRDALICHLCEHDPTFPDGSPFMQTKKGFKPGTSSGIEANEDDELDGDGEVQLGDPAATTGADPDPEVEWDWTAVDEFGWCLDTPDI
jgi:hypothetical protein